MILGWVLIAVSAVVSSASGARIVGGQPVSIDKYPGTVQVEMRVFVLFWNLICGGTILSSRVILSAARCFDGPLYSNSNRRIRAGTSCRNSGGTVIGVYDRVNHPNWGLNGDDSDIAIIRLKSSLNYEFNIQPVAIVTQGYQVPDNVAATQAGWGTTSYGGQLSECLRDVEIRTINKDLCVTRYQQLSPPRTVTDNMICTGILDVGGKGACLGDSGGPLLHNAILVGIVSWGEECGIPTYPGVSTKVSSFTNWIVDTAANF